MEGEGVEGKVMEEKGEDNEFQVTRSVGESGNVAMESEGKTDQKKNMSRFSFFQVDLVREYFIGEQASKSLKRRTEQREEDLKNELRK